MSDSILIIFAEVASGSEEGVAGWMKEYFDVEKTWELWWLFLGLLAQLIFFGRWIVQWISSERRGESHVPVLFWWCSLLGASMLLVYFVGRREPIGILGQLTGWTVYSRNLYLIYRNKNRVGGSDKDPNNSGSNDSS